MSQPQQTIRTYFKSLAVIHMFLTGGLVLLACLAYFVLPVKTASNDENTIFLIAALIFTAIDLYSGFNLFKARIKEIKKMSSLNEKLIAYRALLIIRFALIEAPAMVSLVFYFNTSNILFLGITAAMVLLFLKLRPTREAAIDDLELDWTESGLLDDPDRLIGTGRQ